MLDKLWSFETMEEIEQFKQELPLFRRQQIETLLEMVKLQVTDDMIDSHDTGVYPTALDLLDRLRKTS